MLCEKSYGDGTVHGTLEGIFRTADLHTSWQTNTAANTQRYGKRKKCQWRIDSLDSWSGTIPPASTKSTSKHSPICGTWNRLALQPVQTSNKIMSTKGVTHKGAITFAEWGTLITMAFTVNSQGNNIPPQSIFHRKKFQPLVIYSRPTAALAMVQAGCRRTISMYFSRILWSTPIPHHRPRWSFFLTTMPHTCPSRGFTSAGNTKLFCCLSLPIAPINSNLWTGVCTGLSICVSTPPRTAGWR